MSTMSNEMAACSVGGLAAQARRPASSSGMRLSRQAVSASSWTSWISVGVWGWGGRVLGRQTAVWLVRPLVSAERRWPVSARGPVEWLARLAVARREVSMGVGILVDMEWSFRFQITRCGDGRRGGVGEVVEGRRMMAGGWSVTAMSVVG